MAIPYFAPQPEQKLTEESEKVELLHAALAPTGHLLAGSSSSQPPLSGLESYQHVHLVSQTTRQGFGLTTDLGDFLTRN